MVLQPYCHLEPSKLFRRGMFVLFALLLAAWGCSRPRTVDPVAKPFAGITLRVAVPAQSPARAMLERMGRIWSDRSGGTLELVPIEAASDVRVFRPWEMGKLVDKLSPLDLTALKGLADYEFGRLLRHEVERDMDWGGQAMALPLMGESLFLVYRQDLITDPRHAAQLDHRFRERFRHGQRPGGPATWQEIELIAEYFSKEAMWGAGEKQPVPRPSLTPLPTNHDDFDREFHAIAASFVRRSVNQERSASLDQKSKTELFFTYHFDSETGAPAIARPGFVAALELMKRLQAYRPHEPSERPLEAFRKGRAVAALATLGDLQMLQDPDSSVRGRFAISRVPGSDQAYDFVTRKVQSVPEAQGNFVPYQGHGGWLGGVDVASKHKDVAIDLLVFLSSPPQSLEIVCEWNWPSGPTRSPHIDNRSGWFNFGLDAALSGQLVAALDAQDRAPLLNPASRLRLANEAAFTRAFVEGVRPALTGATTPAAALQEVASAWNRLAPDRAAILREYRLSLGLK